MIEWQELEDRRPYRHLVASFGQYTAELLIPPHHGYVKSYELRQGKIIWKRGGTAALTTKQLKAQAEAWMREEPNQL